MNLVQTFDPCYPKSFPELKFSSSWHWFAHSQLAFLHMCSFTCLFQLENTYMQLFWNEAHLLVSHIVDPTYRAYWDLNLASGLEGKKGDGVGPEEHWQPLQGSHFFKTTAFSLSKTVDFHRCRQSGCFYWQINSWDVGAQGPYLHPDVPPPGVLSSTYKIVIATLLAAVTEYVARTGFGGRVYCGSQFGGPPILVEKAWSYTHGWADPIVFTVRKWGECMLVPSWSPPLFG